MSQTTTPATAPPASGSRWPLFIIGLVIFILGPVSMMIQMQMGYLRTSWQMPILASIGVLLMLASVMQRGGVLRILGFGVFFVLTALMWFMTLVMIRVPEYAGPATVGKKIPAFETSLATGESFSNKDLEKGESTVLVFFRGHW